MPAARGPSCLWVVLLRLELAVMASSPHRGAYGTSYDEEEEDRDNDGGGKRWAWQGVISAAGTPGSRFDNGRGGPRCGCHDGSG